MKDYRLSEIKAGKVDLDDEKKDLGFFDDVYCWIDQINIEPRDMIELPYKDKIYEGIYKVLWRQNGINGILISIFNTEPEADEFIAKLKEKNNE